MALSTGNEEHALLAVWQLVAELSEQLNQNRAATASLQAQVGVLKVSGDGSCAFVSSRLTICVT